MMSTSDPGSRSGEPLRRRKRRDYSLLVLAAGIFLPPVLVAWFQRAAELLG